MRWPGVAGRLLVLLALQGCAPVVAGEDETSRDAPAESRIGIAEAIAAACAHPEIRERLDDAREIRVEADFAAQWRVWIVTFYSGGRRAAFASVGLDGTVLEYRAEPRGGERGDRRPSPRSERIDELRRELEAARASENEVEIREVTELLRRLEGESPASREPRRPQPRAIEESTLPAYDLRIAESALEAMRVDVTQDIEVKGTLALEGRKYPVEVRFRGASTRHAAKKSYRVRFSKETPIDREVTYLKAEPMDHTMQQEKLSCDLFREAGALVSRASYVNLFLNGRYEGVYLDIEPVRSPFKESHGLDPDGTLYRAATFQHIVGWEGLGEVRGDGDLADLRELLTKLNRVERGDFEELIRAETDWPRVRDYLALQAICHRSEIEADDYFLYRDAESGRWSLIPWDHNNGNLSVVPYGDRVAEPSVPLYLQTLRDVGWRANHWFVLPSRVFHNDRLRAEYLERLRELSRELLLSGKADDLIDENYQRLRPEYPSDPYRTAFEGRDPFLDSNVQLKRFVRRHGERLLRLIELASRETPSALSIEEFAFGEDSGWVELHNRGNRPEDLRGILLVTKDAEGNHEYALPETEPLAPGAYRAVTIPRGGAPFPGYDPGGGFVGLVQRNRGDDAPRDDDTEAEERREALLDFYFYGPQREGLSYGRWRDGFTWLEPTPGAPNEPSAGS